MQQKTFLLAAPDGSSCGVTGWGLQTVGFHHDRQRDLYRVTHLPTGLAIIDIRTPELAEDVARLLDPLLPAAGTFNTQPPAATLADTLAALTTWREAHAEAYVWLGAATATYVDPTDPAEAP